MNTRILVTGGEGMLGHALKKVCPHATFATREDTDLRELSQVEKLFETVKPEVVLHCAARVGGVKANAEDNAGFFADNVQINTNVLSIAEKNRVSRLISFLSSCAFQMYPERPSSEEDLHEGVPFEGDRGYAYSKRMLDLQTQMIWKQSQLRFTTMTPVTMYGPHDDWDLESAHVLSALIHKCFLAKRSQQPFEVWGSGQAVRQFVFVDDVARLVCQALETIEGPETIILAPDEGISVRELAEMIARVMGYDGPIAYGETKLEGQSKKVLKSSRFQRLFPDFIFTSLEEGLRSTVTWFEKSMEIKK